MGNNKLKRVVNAALTESKETDLRSSRFVIYGLDDEYGDDFVENSKDIVHTVLGYSHPVVAVSPINNKENSPILVQLQNPDIVRRVLKQARKLKSSMSYSSVYLAPDRSPEERKNHKKLVGELKKILPGGGISKMVGFCLQTW